MRRRLAVVLLSFMVSFIASADSNLDSQLVSALKHAGFTGTMQSQLEKKLGRRIDPELADLGRLLWFDRFGGLHSDNTCGDSAERVDADGIRRLPVIASRGQR